MREFLEYIDSLSNLELLGIMVAIYVVAVLIEWLIEKIEFIRRNLR